jgi:Flp pilus assembly protein TadG
MVVLALGIFLLGAIGLGIDGSRLYAERQMAQSAADAAAQAAMMSVFDGTNTTATGGAAFVATAGSNFPCLAGSFKTPCVYAQRNSFGTPKDIVVIDFPDSSVVPGVNLWIPPDPTMPNLARATVTRRVDTTLMQLLGSYFTDVTAIGVAAIVSYDLTPPILVLDPTVANALDMQGTPDIRITGGGASSIQVNSDNSSAFQCGGTPLLSVPGTVGVWGGPGTLPCKNSITGGGAYLNPSSPRRDFLADVAAPSDPGAPLDTCSTGTVKKGPPPCPSGPTYGCKVANCTLYYPGHYSSININEDVLFMPGRYYITSGNFAFASNATAGMATCSAPGDPLTGCGMVVSFAGDGQQVTVDTNAGKKFPYIDLVGDTLGTYGHSVIFSRHTGSSGFGGGGTMTVTGTIYLPNQQVNLGGNGGGNTTVIGNILVDTLSLSGGGIIKMTLDPKKIPMRQVALVR